MKFHVFQDTEGQWRWKLVARNGKTIAVSGEGYKRKRHAVKMVYTITQAIEHGTWDTEVHDERP